MVEFSASDIALTGFGIVRYRPKAILTWAGLQLIVAVVFSLLMIGTIGPELSQIASGGLSHSSDPTQAMAAFRKIIPIYGLMAPLSLVFYAILFATMSRAVLRPDEDRYGYLRLGGDELRQGLLLLLMFAVGLGAYVAFIMAAIIVGVVVGIVFAVAQHGSASPGMSVAAGGLVLLLVVALLCGWIYVWVRLSLASPLTFATQRVNLFGSWALTRGRFWPLFGAYIVSFILGMLVSVVGLVLSLILGGLFGGWGAAATALFHPDMSSVQLYLTPARLTFVLIGALSSAVAWPVLMTPPAAVYKSLTGS
jgi:hypothetical protein